ncbi:MAG: US12 family protein [Atopobiaceae bacterium]|nr:US12 family protein [Atopobiaceae bacterium]MBR3315991.1 US12 family protein [Atopobiaceae bacterium]
MARDLSVMGNQIGAPTITRRAYNALTFGIVAIAFLITWGEYSLIMNGSLNFLLQNGLVTLLVSFVLTIVGIVLMSVGKSKQSVGVSVGGFALFTLTFGATTALALTHYSVGTIAYAFLITACLAGIFLVAGVIFPEFFSRIGGVLMIGLIGLIIIEFVAVVLFHANQTLFDYVAIALFCGFLGYDAFLMSQDAPTVPNAIFYATDIFLDIVNILIRILNIMDRD